MEERLKIIYQQYKRCITYISVETQNGETHVGTGFHIGDGLIVTAKHVVHENEIISIGGVSKPLSDRDIILSENDDNDLAILKTEFNLEHYLKNVEIVGGPSIKKTDHIPIGGHLDDWIGDEFILSKAVIVGYPRIPFSKNIDQVSIIGEVNAVLDTFTGKSPYFVMSGVPRSGFSGGPVISEFDFLLGVVTRTFIRDIGFEEPGFLSALSIEPLLELLAQNNLRPPGVDNNIWELFT